MELYNSQTIQIVSDDNLTQPFAVIIKGVEVYRVSTYAKAEGFILWHQKQGTLLSKAVRNV